jgi:hypothetical protein
VSESEREGSQPMSALGARLAKGGRMRPVGHACLCALMQLSSAYPHHVTHDPTTNLFFCLSKPIGMQAAHTPMHYWPTWDA